MNQYDTKHAKHRKDTDLTWKKNEGKTLWAPANNKLTIFGWLEIAGDL